MDNILKNFIKNLCKDQSRTLVGRVCKQAEILQEQQKNRLFDLKKQTIDKDDKTCEKTEVRISEIEKSIADLDLLKKLNKELIYEEFRDFRNAIIFYLEGRKYQKYPIYNPLKEDNS